MHFSGLCIISLFALANTFSISNRVITLYKKNEIKQIKEFEPLFETNPKAKVVVSTPGGLFGFYFMGISAYIKENYNLTNYIFTGASAGSWNSLFLSLNDDPFKFKKKILKVASKSKKSIYRYISKEKLPSHKVGQTHLIRKADLLRWIESRKIRRPPSRHPRSLGRQG